ncbi:MAG: peroxidase-related enzyme [Bryobacterales bacterium]
MYLPSVENNAHPGGEYASLIESLGKAGAPTPQIMHLFAFKHEMTQHLRRLTHEVMRGPSPLTPAFRELIAAFVSSRNACRFCAGSHVAVAAKLYQDRPLVEAVVADYRGAPLQDSEKKLLAYLEKLTLAPATTSAEDVQQLRDIGWSDEAVYDAVTVCAMFNFYNRWVEGSGVQDMPQQGYEASGERIARQGYAGSFASTAS